MVLVTALQGMMALRIRVPERSVQRSIQDGWMIRIAVSRSMNEAVSARDGTEGMAMMMMMSLVVAATVAEIGEKPESMVGRDEMTRAVDDHSAAAMCNCESEHVQCAQQRRDSCDNSVM